ncbi:MAG TPA: hypothetical protein VGP42_12695 [Stellaceae bacterium]|nr:hypothetical protein [Stellaceae bacterium]
MQPDLAPFVDEPGADVFVGLVDIAVQQLEGQSLGARLLQQARRLGPGLLEIRPKAGDLLQLVLRRGQRGAGKDDAADSMNVSDLGERRDAVPAINRQRQGAADSSVAERLPLVVRGDQAAAVPVALLHRDPLAERGFQFIARGGRETAKLDGRAVAADRVDPGRLLVGENALEPVEVGQPGMVVIRVANPGDRLAGLVGDELERARSQDVLLVPMRVLVEVLLLVDEGERVGERRQEGAGGKFQPEDDSLWVRRLDPVHHHVPALARADDALRREDDVLPARLDIGRGQRRSVVEFDPDTQIEGVGPAVIGRLWHLGAQVAHEIGGGGRVLRVDSDQDAVERRRRVQHREGALAMTVKARRRVGRDQIGQRAAMFWRFLASRCRGSDRDERGQTRCAKPSA